MNKILAMREKRGQIWDKAKAYLNAHQDENGMLSAEDAAEYERMENEVAELGRAIDREERAAQIEREMNAPVSVSRWLPVRTIAPIPAPVVLRTNTRLLSGWPCAIAWGSIPSRTRCR